MTSPAADVAPSDLPPCIVLFDGVCGLCHRLVRFLVRADRRRSLRYAPLQGETAARLRAMHSGIPLDLDTVVFVENGRVYLRSHAILRACHHLGWPWRAAAVFAILPRPLTDALYGVVARVRYRIFGRLETCEIPTITERSLVLP